MLSLPVCARRAKNGLPEQSLQAWQDIKASHKRGIPQAEERLRELRACYAQDQARSNP